MSKTPGRSPRRSVGDAVSPLCVSRMEEKKQLIQLNQRLEQYILKQRERDAEGDVIVYPNASNPENEARIKELLDENSKLRAEKTHLDTKLRQLEDDSNQNKKRQAADINKLRKQKEKLQRDNEDLQSQLNDLKDRLSQLGDYDDWRKRAIAAESEIDKIRDSESRFHTTEITLREQLRKLTEENSSIVRDARTEFARQLEEHLKKTLEKHERVHQDVLNNIKATYEEKLNSYRDYLQRAGHELEEEKKKVEEMKEELTANEMELRRLRRDMEDMQRKNDQLVQDLAKKGPSKEIENLRRVLHRFQAAFRAKEAQIDKLFSNKIELLRELKQYDDLLQEEETRLAKKRRKTQQASAIPSVIPSVPASTSADPVSPFLFAQADIHYGSFIKIRNSSIEEASLSGWSIQTLRESKRFDFPDITLASGEGVTVWIGDAANDHNEVNDLKWDSEEPIWDEKGDEAWLVDENGAKIDSFSLIGRNPSGIDVDIDADIDADDGEGKYNDDDEVVEVVDDNGEDNGVTNGDDEDAEEQPADGEQVVIEDQSGDDEPIVQRADDDQPEDQPDDQDTRHGDDEPAFEEPKPPKRKRKSRATSGRRRKTATATGDEKCAFM